MSDCGSLGLCSWPALGTASAAVESTGASILVAVGHAFDAGGELLRRVVFQVEPWDHGFVPRLSWPELQVESQIQEVQQKWQVYAGEVVDESL